MNFFDELKRRNVFRVAGVYAVVGWLLTQVASALENALSLPSWFDAVIVSALLIGFPVALVFAWAFEMTPDGVKRTANVPEGESIAPKTGRKLDYAILGGLALVAAVVLADRLAPGASAPPRNSGAGGASVAVLPFIDLSPDGDQEYFSDGISEEILNVLVRIPELKVAGRTSSFSFKGKDDDLRKIGETLGVDHMLEGSVRKAGAKLRITAQLIRSDDGFHMWSETYDRELTDVFVIQDEIAKAVANELAASLGLAKVAAPKTAKAHDVAAYEAYLKAQDLYRKRGGANLRRAQDLLTEAVARGPDYAEAWAQLAAVLSVLSSWIERDDDWPHAFRQMTETGAAAAARAIEIDPDNGRALASRGILLGYKGDLVGAFQSLDAAVEKDPKNPEILDSFAQNANQVGYFVEGEAAARRAVEADPLSAVYLNTLGWSLAGQSKYDDAIAVFERAIAANPNNPFPYFNGVRAWLAKGDPAGAAKLFRRAAQTSGASRLDRERAQALARALDALASGASTGDALAEDPDFAVLGFAINRYIGDKEKAAAIAHKAFAQPPDTEILIFAAPAAFHDDPVWKKAVRDQGVLALWRARGFPEWCRAVGADDFECG